MTARGKELEAQLEASKKRLEVLLACIALLEAKIAALTRKSSNSSKSPSSNLPGSLLKKKAANRNKRKRGGRHGRQNKKANALTRKVALGA